MKKISIIVLGVTTALLGSTACQAQVTLDVRKITCWQFATHKIANPKFIAIWLNGYHHGARGDTIIDTRQLDTDTKKMLHYCINNPNALLMQGAETILGLSK